jgi:5'-nucleotidase
VDCVKLAICKLINEHVDLVISGINHGSNLGTDVLYSGTVSAAAEGVILGSPSLAVSLDSERVDADFNFCSRFIRRLITGIMKPDMDKTTLLNVNVPARPQQDIKGVRITRLGVRNYGNLFEERRDPRGNIYYWMGGGIIAEKQEPDSDVLAVEQGYVSVTPIHLDLTDYNLINKYRALPEKTLEFLVKGE